MPGRMDKFLPAFLAALLRMPRVACSGRTRSRHANSRHQKCLLKGGHVAKPACLGVLLLLFLSVGASAQGGLIPSAPGIVYQNTALGFRYVQPIEMEDITESSKEEIKAHAAARQTSRAISLALAMSSGGDDTVPEWHSLAIESYPRMAVDDIDDSIAEAKMSAWVAHTKEAAALPRSVIISGQIFAVYVFGAQEGRVKKGAVVWTTIRRGKLLSFAFLANSPVQLKALAETMKTVQFF